MDKSLDKQFLTTSNLIGQKELKKLKETPLPSLLDLNLTRVYFTSLGDGFSRIFILIIQIFWIGLIFFNGIGFGQLVANLPGIPSAPVFQSAILKVVAMLVTVLFAFIILIMILPVFLSKTIRGIGLSCLFFLIFGSIVNLIIIGISFFMFSYSDSPYRMTVLIFAVIALLLWWIAILHWWLNTIENKKYLIKSIIKMYELSFR
ncbi:hypothetical protein [Spiroplasma ixodetis]|uniref:hypothetical protein n=1 Tax=Spiroplasma ixodetis TaxID=2141 RepID=UPI002578099D|nr:hypothetical protein [Spiroplasma ixodetis]WJG69668.1 hypothetical protein SIXOD_v1c05880 [Spiroplasma ixodetis Y32]